MISRRRFLVAAAVTLSATAAAAYMAKPHIRELVLPKLDTRYPLGILQDSEMRSIVALGMTLVTRESTPSENFFIDYVNVITKNQHGFLREYQRAAAYLNATSTDQFGRGARFDFADLSLSQRDKVLEKLLWQYQGHDRIVRKVEKLVASRDAIALRMYVMNPLIEYYYRSTYGWAIVGYESFPGLPPRHPRAYTEQLVTKA
jgi:hypothetical protein